MLEFTKLNPVILDGRLTLLLAKNDPENKEDMPKLILFVIKLESVMFVAARFVMCALPAVNPFDKFNVALDIFVETAFVLRRVGIVAFVEFRLVT